MQEISKLSFSPAKTLTLLKAQQDAAIDGILVIDENRKVLSYNRRFIQLWGIPAEIAALGEDAPLIGHVVSNLSDVPSFLSKIMYLYEHPSESSRDEINLTDGRVFDRYSSPVIDGRKKNLGRIWFFRDITDRKTLEKELQIKSDKLVESLEEVKQVNEELHGILEQLEGKNKEIEQRNEEIEQRNKNMMASIHYAKRIQRAMLPEEKHLKKFFPNCFVLNKPRDIVSGDFFWCDGVEHKKFLVAADCTGHGIPGAFMSLLGMSGFTDIIIQKEIHDAGLILRNLHQYISLALRQNVTESQDGMELVIIVLNTLSQQVSYAGAMNALFYIQNDELFEIKATKMPIGGSQHGMDRYYENHVISVVNETTFYLCSDGYQDKFGGPLNRKFTSGRMKKLFLEIYQKPLLEQEVILDSTFENWRIEGNEGQIDDMLVIGVKI